MSIGDLYHQLQPPFYTTFPYGEKFAVALIRDHAPPRIIPPLHDTQEEARAAATKILDDWRKQHRF